jgi:hypothetical protein
MLDADPPGSRDHSDDGAPHAWEQRPDEPGMWFERFTLYRLLGSRRTFYAAWIEDQARQGAARRGKKGKTGLPQAWRTQAKRWQWLGRAQAWDAYRRQRDEQMWERRREEIRKREWDMAERLLTKAGQMLEFPLAETTREQVSADGITKVITMIAPARWGMADTARIADTASKLGRLSAEMETSREVVVPAAQITSDELAKARAETQAWEDKLMAEPASINVPGAPAESSAEKPDAK